MMVELEQYHISGMKNSYSPDPKKELMRRMRRLRNMKRVLSNVKDEGFMSDSTFESTANKINKEIDELRHELMTMANAHEKLLRDIEKLTDEDE